MVQEEAAVGKIDLLSASEILSLARSVDEVTRESFQVLGRQAKIPAPTIIGGQEDGFGTEEKDGKLYRRKYRSGNYTDIFATQLPLRFSKKIDGRVIAVRFIDHLVEIGYNYSIARPPQLDDPEFTPKKLEDTQLDLLLQPTDESKRIQFEKTRREIGYLLDYAGGRVEIVDEAGALKYDISGVLPQTKLILITTPIGGERTQGPLYRSFLEKLGN